MQQTLESKISNGAMATALTYVLGNTCRLFRTLLCCAWNARGPGALEASRLFKAQARELYDAQDQIAERIGSLDGIAVPDDSDLVIVQRPAEIGLTVSDPDQLAVTLAAGQEGAILSLKAACDVAREIDDAATLHVLNERIVAHESQLLALRRLRAK